MTRFFDLGFRPFFYLGALTAAALIFQWNAILKGWWAVPAEMDPVLWHAHEMIFGFVVTAIAGFILTASKNWSGLPALAGGRLKSLVFVWLLARLIPLAGPQYSWLFAIVDLSFLPLLMYYLTPYLWKNQQARHKVYYAFFVLLSIGNLFVHLEFLQIYEEGAKALLGSIYIIIILIVFLSGRLIPFFFEKAIERKWAAKPGASAALSQASPSTSSSEKGSLPQITSKKWLDVIALVSIVIFTVAATFWETSPVTAWVALATALIQLARWLNWKPWHAVSIPILFILYVAYLWVVIGLVLFACSIWNEEVVTLSAPVHSFTIGAIATMIYGMFTRVALGHTQRPIHASPMIIVGYILVTVAALLRVFGPMISPSLVLSFIHGAGWAWVIAFVIYLVKYAPVFWPKQALK